MEGDRQEVEDNSRATNDLNRLAFRGTGCTKHTLVYDSSAANLSLARTIASTSPGSESDVKS